MQNRPTTQEIRELLADLAEIARTPYSGRDQVHVDQVLARKREMLKRLEDTTDAAASSTPSPRWLDTGSGPGWSDDASS